LDALSQSPVIQDAIRGAVRVERLYGSGDLPFFYRTPFGPGWALVGDAGHHKDPILARGICDALADAEALSRALCTGLGGDERVLDSAPPAWPAGRDERTPALYELTYRLSLLGPTSAVMARVYEAARADARVASRFHGVISGALPHAEFFVSSD